MQREDVSEWEKNPNARLIEEVARLRRERDAAFAAGQREMRERAAVTALEQAAADSITDDTCIITVSLYIRALPIKSRPE